MKAFVLYNNFKEESRHFKMNRVFDLYSIYQFYCLNPHYDIILYGINNNFSWFKWKFSNIKILNNIYSFDNNCYIDRIFIPFHDYIINKYTHVISLDNDLYYFDRKNIIKEYDKDIECFSGIPYKNSMNIDCILATINIYNIRNINSRYSKFDCVKYIKEYNNILCILKKNTYELNNEEYIMGRMYHKEDFTDLSHLFNLVHHYCTTKKNKDKKIIFYNKIKEDKDFKKYFLDKNGITDYYEDLVKDIDDSI